MIAHGYWCLSTGWRDIAQSLTVTAEYLEHDRRAALDRQCRLWRSKRGVSSIADPPSVNDLLLIHRWQAFQNGS